MISELVPSSTRCVSQYCYSGYLKLVLISKSANNLPFIAYRYILQLC